MDVDSIIQTNLAKRASKYEFSSTQLNLPAEVATTVRRMARDIKPSDLVRPEYKPHITLKYGLHTSDSQPVKSVLAGEGPIRVRLGRTEVFSAAETGEEHDVVKVKVFSPDARRVHSRLIRALPHTTTHPKYQPHLTLAYVKKGKGKKYADRNDLEGKELTFDDVTFSSKSGRKTSIPLKKSAAEQYMRGHSALPWLLAGGLGGAGIGRYLIAPALTRLLGLNPRTARRTLTGAGLLAGSIPGIMLGLNQRRMKGNFFAPTGRPRNAMDFLNQASFALGKSPGYPFESSTSNARDKLMPAQWKTQQTGEWPARSRGSLQNGPVGMEKQFVAKSAIEYTDTYSPKLWKPTFPVAMSMDAITNNPMIPLMHKIKMRKLIAESGKAQGVGLTGEASPGALMEALPRVVRHAVPTVGGALIAAKLLGAPRWLTRGSVGAALVYSALKGFMDTDR